MAARLANVWNWFGGNPPVHGSAHSAHRMAAALAAGESGGVTAAAVAAMGWRRRRHLSFANRSAA